MRTNLKRSFAIIALAFIAVMPMQAKAQWGNAGGGIGINFGLDYGMNNNWGNQGWGNQGWGNQGWGNQGWGNQGYCMTGMEQACFIGQGNMQFMNQWNNFQQPWQNNQQCMYNPMMCQGRQGMNRNRVASGGGRVNMPVSWAGQQQPGYYDPRNPNIYSNNRNYQNPYNQYYTGAGQINPVTGRPM